MHTDGSLYGVPTFNRLHIVGAHGHFITRREMGGSARKGKSGCHRVFLFSSRAVQI